MKPDVAPLTWVCECGQVNDMLIYRCCACNQSQERAWDAEDKAQTLWRQTKGGKWKLWGYDDREWRTRRYVERDRSVIE